MPVETSAGSGAKVHVIYDADAERLDYAAVAPWLMGH